MTSSFSRPANYGFVREIGNTGDSEIDEGCLTCGGTAMPSEPSSFLKVCGGSNVLFTTALV